ncbi:Pre-mRNA-splicing factor cef1 [Coemansia sp. RSA 1813]|nr:Pre-mRNA-splicing factor cef1 [Coemansia sp. RSA 1843]KAJ2214991.1 Pre-mRNA-splicing factor cef1 [Coemansia sp. RSA 487]KAJ2565740.1 Pre-mRNA-splicing factor cef1 [Coemansia sp. RSA 1813]
MRVHLKGGVWKNTEDEILKAAVMKYGKTQWARISSLLVRKTPKQCKARWYEWLDPSIKKTEWSKEEDEKLLHLAKLMPTQWRTIAPIVGRTPAQCLERYQRLLDEAEARTAGEDDDLGLRGEAGAEGQAASSDARRLRPGEINPNPETRPARPDPVDMDEDEKDMLSEARARLANTQGKKAKRKARERQIEEARRLATLQKRRELKAAGVELKAKKLKKHKAHIDYNAEIPYEKKPVPGFYDTTEELSHKGTGADSLKGKFLDNLEAKSRLDREDESRKEAKRKRDNKNKNDVAFVRASDQKAVDAIAAKEEAEQLAKRKKLVLPLPQVNDAELETIAKLGQQGALAKELVGGTDRSTLSDALLGDYSEAPSATVARTPRTPAQSDRLMNEALAQRAMAMQATPLLGSESAQRPAAPGQGTGFGGAMPHGGSTATPNPFATPFRPSAQGSASGASGSGKNPSAVRDELGLNTPTQEVGATPRERKMASRGLREQLARKLASLPKPKNEFEIVVPEPTSTSAENEATDGVAALNIGKDRDAGTSAIVEDQAEVERRIEEQLKLKVEQEQSRRSRCVQRNLPRPDMFATDKLAVSLGTLSDGFNSSPEVLSLINDEMKALILNDARKYPVPDAPPLRYPNAEKIQLEEISDDLLVNARALIDEEIENMHQDVRNAYDHLSGHDSSELWHAIENNNIWLPQERSYQPTDQISTDMWIEKYKTELTRRRETMAEEASRATKVERKLGVILGGYQARAKVLDDKIVVAFKEFEQVKVDTQAFNMLYASEQAAIPARIEKAQEELRKVETREAQLQSEYQELLDHRNALAAEIEAKSKNKIDS